MDDIRDMIAAERGALAEVLAGLPAERWDEPTLCSGWRVREVVAHITMPFRYSGRRFFFELAKSRGRFSVMADRCARRDAAMLSAAELTAALADNVNHPWKPPGGGLAGALTHDIIHGLDITVPLGIERQVPPDRLGVLLAGLGSPKTLRFFGVDLSGVELRATDTDAAVAGWASGSDAAGLATGSAVAGWASGSDVAGLASGSGSPVTGAAQDLALVLCGRKLPKGHLEGENSDRFTVA